MVAISPFDVSIGAMARYLKCIGLFSSLSGYDGHNLLVALGAAKFHGAGDHCINRVVLANANARTGVNFGAALADDDVAGDGEFAAEQLYAETPASGITTVAG